MANKRQIGAIIKLDGEASFKASISNCKTAIAAMKTELKNIQSNYRGNANSLEALSAMQEKYAEIQKTAAAQVENMTRAYEKSQESERKAKTAMQEMLEAYEQAEKELTAMKEGGEASAEALAEQSAKADEAQAMYDAYAAQVEKAETRTNRFRKALTEAKTEEHDAGEAVQQYAAYIDEAKNSADGAAHSIDEYGNAVSATGEAANGAGSAIDTMRGVLGANFATASLSAVVNGLKDAAEYAVEVGQAFESAMSKVEALSGATGSDLDALKDKAAELGRSTQYSAAEVSDALSYMALAGWNTQQMLSSIDGVLNLAKSSQMDLAEASDIVTDYITAFGLSAKDAAHFVDIMAYAQAHSNTTTSALGEAYKNCAATAGQMGYSVEETTAALMTMANAGIRGGESGTALNALMIRLSTNTKGCADELAKYGVTIYDNNGNMKSLTSILTGISEAFSGLNDEESANLSKVIAGQNQYAAFQTVLAGMSDAVKANGQSFEDYTGQLENCDNTAKNIADTMSNNLEGDMKSLESATEGLGDAVYEYLNGPIRGVVQTVTDAVNGVTDAIEPQTSEVQKFVSQVVQETEQAKRSLASIDEEAGSGFSHVDEMADFIDSLDKIRSKTGLTEYETYQLNQTIKNLSADFPELNDYIDDTGKLLGLSKEDFSNLKQIMTTEYSRVLAEVIVNRRNAYVQLQADAKAAMEAAGSGSTEAASEAAETLQKNKINAMDIIKYIGGDKTSLWDKILPSAKALKTLDDAKKATDENSEAYQKATEQVEKYKKEFPELAEQFGIAEDEQGNWVVSLDEATDATEAAADATETAGGKVKDTAEDVTDTVRDAVDTYIEKINEMANADPSDAIRDTLATAAEQVQNFQSQIQSNLQSFSLFGDRSSLVEAYTSTNRDEMMKNMSWAIGSMKNYTQELDLLKQRGVSTDFIEYLTSQGQAGLNYVHSLALATDGELQQFQDAFDEYNSYMQGINDNVKQLMTDYGETIMSGIPEGKEAWHKYGIDTMQGWFDAIDEGIAAIKNGYISGDIREAMQVVLQNRYDNTRLTGFAGAVQTINDQTSQAKNTVNNILDRINVNVTTETHNYIDGEEVRMATANQIREQSKITGRR